MQRTREQLRQDALAIWTAGVEAVKSDGLVQANVRVRDGRLLVGSESLDLARIRRILVVGAAKPAPAWPRALKQRSAGK